MSDLTPREMDAGLTTSVGAAAAASDEVLPGVLDSVVRGIPGVDTVYPAGSRLVSVLAAGAQALGMRTRVQPILVETVDGRLRIGVAVGVDGRIGAAETGRLIVSEVAATCSAHGFDDVDVRVTISHIAESADRS